MTDVEKLLRELIALPSVNPAFLPANDPRTGESRVADFLAVAAARIGMEVDFQKVWTGRSNLVARLRPANRVKQTILLAPHMDTVGGTPEQFAPRASKGRIYGRGACDTKGSIAAMLTALNRLARQKRRPAATEIVFACLVDEENAQTGARALTQSGLRADLAIVGEPTQLQIVTAHKGSLWFRMETKGKAAHGACPHLGKNAVHEMSRIVDLLETAYAQRIRRRSHPLLGPPTINVGYMHGGTQPNIVPASCVAGIDRRTIPGETDKSVRAELNSWMRRHGLHASMASEKPSFCLPMETDSRLPLVRQFLRVAGQKKAVGVDFFCDASVLAQAGIPSVVFGPGDIAQAHTADEWVSQRSLAGATEMLLQFLRGLP